MWLASFHVPPTTVLTSEMAGWRGNVTLAMPVAVTVPRGRAAAAMALVLKVLAGPPGSVPVAVATLWKLPASMSRCFKV